MTVLHHWPTISDRGVGMERGRLEMETGRSCGGEVRDRGGVTADGVHPFNIDVAGVHLVIQNVCYQRT
jgi:hypothetical protein